MAAVVSDLVDFLNASPTAFHAVEDEAKRLLKAAGFEQLSEREEWTGLQPGRKYFFTRNHSAIVAFAIGAKYVAGNGFHIIGAHTDSPCLKLKPVTKITKGGYLEVGVQTYGGGLWYTWFDRDLTIAGRVLVREKKDGVVSYGHKLVRVQEPIMRIPTLAIHLDRTISSEGLKINNQNHLVPVLGTLIKHEMQKLVEGNVPGESSGGENTKHHPLLLQLIAKEANCEVDEICDFELQLCDTQPSVVAGAMKEFIFSGRLDNLCMSFCSLKKGLKGLGLGRNQMRAYRIGRSNLPAVRRSVLPESRKTGSQGLSFGWESIGGVQRWWGVLGWRSEWLEARELGRAPARGLGMRELRLRRGAFGVALWLDSLLDAGPILARAKLLEANLLLVWSNGFEFKFKHKALVESTSTDHSLDHESGVRMVALFDHEEVGSDSAQGAGSPAMLDALTRITCCFNHSNSKLLEKAIQRSFLVSADMAHALHPNYMVIIVFLDQFMGSQEKHEENHQPKLHGGLVIKHNANQRYATNAVTAFIFQEIAERHQLPIQDFVVRNDMACGSTIGPILASGVGIRTVDIGAPQLSMHSIREMCAVDDVNYSYEHLKAYFEEFTELDNKVKVDC
ncbi:Aspartyl aminopeptidase [Triticum urartu]|uniref:Aspartyl aminopeptidase n=1 Tax=Triticum urartu TaxID=4572 RepID=M7Z8B9_TRIUA|nr:Aspartyl aminopeptidase [Triticum urartu]